ncbi:ABC transporter ATP-binding protein [Gloeomargarita lithophora]|uniref:ABC transporter ATP-binding protein n=1 Tax=Gloeomargarita lithophora TaxID=1188228 RepID=UPI003F72C5EA
MQGLGQIIHYFRDYWGLALFSISASSIFELLDLVVPYLIGQTLNLLSQQSLDPLMQGLINQVGTWGSWSVSTGFSMNVLLGLMFLLTVMRAPLQPWLSGYFHWEITLRSRHQQTQRAIAKILSLPLDFYDTHNPGRIAGRVARGLSNHTWTYPDIAGLMLPKMVRVLGIVVVMTWLEWRMALFMFCSFIFILSFSFRKLSYLIKKEQSVDVHQENTESRTSELITNIKTVKAFATEAWELKRQTERLSRELKFVIHKIHLGYVYLATYQRTIVQSCLFFILGFTLTETMAGRISLGHFVTLYTIASMGYAEIEPMSNLLEVLARRYASMVRFHEFLALPDAPDSQPLLLPKRQINLHYTPYQFTGKISLENLEFRYHPKRPVLQEINLLIQPYETIALVGRSGSGKSTLIKLLLRYFSPQKGRILMDGEDIQNLEVTGYRRRLAVVHQEVDVFNGTLLDNLTYGYPQATRTEVAAACAIARVDEFIDLLPQKYYTLVGERGVRLSGGQRQRIGIARALLVQPDVLIFDEATSSLDYESERAIQRAMAQIQGERTTIIIAHRLSTVREANRIVVLDQGRIVEVGNHQELIQGEGIYHRLHALQASGDLL